MKNFMSSTLRYEISDFGFRIAELLTGSRQNLEVRDRMSEVGVKADL